MKDQDLYYMLEGGFLKFVKKLRFLWPLKVGRFLRNWAVEIVVENAITFGNALPLIFL